MSNQDEGRLLVTLHMPIPMEALGGIAEVMMKHYSGAYLSNVDDTEHLIGIREASAKV